MLSQTDNERNHRTHFYSEFCVSVHFSFNQGERLFPPISMLEPWHDAIAFSTSPVCAHSLFWFSPVLSSSLFIIISPQLNHPTLFAAIHLQGPSCYPDLAPHGPTSMLSPFLPSHFYSHYSPCLSPYTHKHVTCISSLGIHLLSTYCTLDTGETIVTKSDRDPCPRGF